MLLVFQAVLLDSLGPRRLDALFDTVQAGLVLGIGEPVLGLADESGFARFVERYLGFE
jgi:hypothetical protein